MYALTLENNNGTFEVTPAVIDRRSRFTIMVRNNHLLDFESRPSVHFEVKYNNIVFLVHICIMLNKSDTTLKSLILSLYYMFACDNRNRHNVENVLSFKIVFLNMLYI